MMSSLQRCSRFQTQLLRKLQYVVSPQRVDHRNSTSTSFIDNLFTTSTSHQQNPTTESLKSTKAVYSFQFHYIQPQHVEEYTKTTAEAHAQLEEDESFPGKLCVSLRSIYGSEDIALHIWKLQYGHPDLDHLSEYILRNEQLRSIDAQISKWCNRSTNQICRRLSYFPGNITTANTEASNGDVSVDRVYELRTYALKPGTLLDWNARWSEAGEVKGAIMWSFYTQIGELYRVYHLHRYKDIEHRVLMRERMYEVEGWDDCVSATQVYVTKMKNSLLLPIQDDRSALM